MTTDPGVESLDIATAHGRLRARRHGDRDAPRLVLCIPGLSANATSFDFLAERLAGDGRQVVALDLRGRGHSETVGPTGWEGHAQDVLEVAAVLARGRPYDLAGHSMGAFVALQAMALPTGPRPRRLVLVDAAGIPEEASMPPIRAAVERLDTVRPTAEEFVAAVRRIGTITPWSHYWDRYFDYELEADPSGGVRSRTDAALVQADLAHGEARDPKELWPAVDMPVLLVRAALPILEGAGWVLAEDDARRFAATVPRSCVVEVPANHYVVITHEATATAVRDFLDAPDA